VPAPLGLRVALPAPSGTRVPACFRAGAGARPYGLRHGCLHRFVRVSLLPFAPASCACALFWAGAGARPYGLRHGWLHRFLRMSLLPFAPTSCACPLGRRRGPPLRFAPWVPAPVRSHAVAPFGPASCACPSIRAGAGARPYGFIVFARARTDPICFPNLSPTGRGLWRYIPESSPVHRHCE
jgi:hypothetical protein